MPVGEQAAQWVTWNHFCFSTSAGFLRSHLFRRRLPSTPPGESLLAGAKACEIAPASLAPVRGSPKPQLDDSALRGSVILLRPGAQFHAQTFRAARVGPGGQTPDAGQEAGVALFAPEGKNAGHGAKSLRKASQPRDADVSRTTLRTDREGHFGFAPCPIIYRHYVAVPLSGLPATIIVVAETMSGSRGPVTLVDRESVTEPRVKQAIFTDSLFVSTRDPQWLWTDCLCCP